MDVYKLKPDLPPFPNYRKGIQHGFLQKEWAFMFNTSPRIQGEFEWAEKLKDKPCWVLYEKGSHDNVQDADSPDQDKSIPSHKQDARSLAKAKWDEEPATKKLEMA